MVHASVPYNHRKPQQNNPLRWIETKRLLQGGCIPRWIRSHTLTNPTSWGKAEKSCGNCWGGHGESLCKSARIPENTWHVINRGNGLHTRTLHDDLNMTQSYTHLSHYETTNCKHSMTIPHHHILSYIGANHNQGCEIATLQNPIPLILNPFRTVHGCSQHPRYNGGKWTMGRVIKGMNYQTNIVSLMSHINIINLPLVS